jgi:hypothetical protein
MLVELYINQQFQGTYTVAAYQEETFRMCTGDFHMHSVKKVEYTGQDYFDLVDGEFEYFEGDQTYSDSLKLVQFDATKKKEPTPRERLLKNQRQLFGVFADVIPLMKLEKRRRA